MRDHLHKIGAHDAVVTGLANRPNWKSFKAVVRHWSPGITVRPFRKQELSQKERKQKGHLRRQSWLHESRPIKASSASSWSRNHHRNQHYGDRHNGYDNRRWNDRDGVCCADKCHNPTKCHSPRQMSQQPSTNVTVNDKCHNIASTNVTANDKCHNFASTNVTANDNCHNFASTNVTANDKC